MLETAIGLVFVFLLVSLLVTAANELLANLLQTRARFLLQGVRAMLGPVNAASGDTGGLLDQLFRHPLIRSLTPPGKQGQKNPGPPAKGPSYIDSTAFATALLDTVGVVRPMASVWQQKLAARLAALPVTGGTVAQVNQAVASTAAELGAALDGAPLKRDLTRVAEELAQGTTDVSRVRDRLTQIKAGIPGGLGWLAGPLDSLIGNLTPAGVTSLSGQIVTAGPEQAELLGRLTPWLNRPQADSIDYASALLEAKSLVAASSAADIRQTLENLPDGDARQTLLILFDEAGGQFAQFKTNVETWYDMTMDRVSGWYKRRTAWVNLALGGILAVVLNVDAVLILRHLSTDPSLRTALVAEAQGFVTNPPAVASKTLPPENAARPDSLPVEASYDLLTRQLSGLSLPVGWGAPDNPGDGTGTRTGPAAAVVTEYRLRPDISMLAGLQGTAWTQLGHTVLFHLVGWLLTAVAASLGAPFWFDLLNKFMNIRQAGVRPKKKKNH